VPGLTVETQNIDPDFVAATFALRSIGDTSPITETGFGWHVIRLVARTPAPASEIEQRRKDLRDVVSAVRTRERIGRLLESAQEHTPIEITPGAQDLMAQVASRQP
jgi:parvulin-like peptidyl-prolyl isomerase